MNEKKLTVIIPVYNGEKHLKQCLDSIIKTNYKKIITYIIDDGSTDNTKKICDFYNKKYSSVFKYYYKPNGGVSSARNYGIDKVYTEFVMFVDADDYLNFENFFEIFEKNSNYDLFLGGFTKFQTDSMKVERFECFNLKSSISAFMQNPNNWLNPPYLLSPWSKVFKTRIIKEYNIKFPINVEYGEDVIFVFNYLMKANTICCIKEAGYYYRKNNNSLSTNFKSNIFVSDMKRYSNYRRTIKKIKCQ